MLWNERTFEGWEKEGIINCVKNSADLSVFKKFIMFMFPKRIQYNIMFQNKTNKTAIQIFLIFNIYSTRRLYYS